MGWWARWPSAPAPGGWLRAIARLAGATAARAHNLGLVVANSRFLIVPGIEVAHLASHVLGLCVKRLPLDWQARYGYRPLLLESFVERARFKGTCYRAANWVHVGHTCGRGRQDRGRCAGVPVKDVYLYPLQADWRARLCQRRAQPGVARAAGRGRRMTGLGLGAAGIGPSAAGRCAAPGAPAQSGARFLRPAAGADSASLRHAREDQGGLPLLRSRAHQHGCHPAIALSGHAPSGPAASTRWCWRCRTPPA